MVNKNLNYIDPTAIENWNDHVMLLKNSSFFHSSFWAKVLTQSYDYRPMYVANFANNSLNSLLPLMMINSRLTGKRAVSLPFTDICEPLGEDQNHFKATLQNIIFFGEKAAWKYAELRGGAEFLPGKKCSVQYYHHRLMLTDENSLLANLKNNSKRNIKKAERESVRVKIDNSSQGMENFFQLNCLTRKKHGLPPQPKRFFKNVHQFIINNNYGNIFIAQTDSQAVAAAVFFHFHDQAIYKYGASDPRFLGLRANNLIMWQALKFYATEKFKVFDFGKTEICNEGLRRFKLSWGAEEKIISYFKYDFSKKDFVQELGKENGWYNFFFRKMPLPLMKATGNMFYKHVG